MLAIVGRRCALLLMALVGLTAMAACRPASGQRQRSVRALNLRLMQAVDANDPDEVKSLLDRGATVNARAWGYESPLLLAVGDYCRNDGSPNHLPVIDLLLARGADVNQAGYQGRTALMQTVEGDYVALAKRLIAHGANVNARDRSGRTPLLYARSWKDYVGLIQLLLDAGANPRLRDRNGVSLLMRAAEQASPAAVRLLLAKGLDVNARDRHGKTPLMWTGTGSEEADYEKTARALLEGGASPLAVDRDGRSALMYAADQGSAAITRLLLERGASVNARDYEGQTPLMHAAARHDLATVSLLLGHGAIVEARDRQGRTPLMLALPQRLFVNDYVEGLLVERGAGVNDRDRNGETPLMYAASEGCAESVEMLLGKGARIGLRTGAGAPP